MYLFSRRARAPSGRDSSQPSTHLQDTFSRRSQPNTFLSILNTSQLLSFNSQFFLYYFSGLTESQVFRRLQNMIGDRPTDNRNDGTV